MPIVLTLETERLVAEQMAMHGISDPNDLLRLALARFVPADHLPTEELLDSVDRANADYRAGRCRPLSDVRALTPPGRPRP